MSDQQQYGLLPCLMQGGVNHETTGKRPYLVRINRVLHVVNIHTPDPESSVRSPAEGRISTFNCNGLPHKVTTVHLIKRHPPALQGAMYLLNTCLYLL
ncbi:modulator of Hok protein [Escherichia coli]|nr:modulator of Hok protein [Escherichia coli]